MIEDLEPPWANIRQFKLEAINDCFEYLSSNC